MHKLHFFTLSPLLCLFELQKTSHKVFLKSGSGSRSAFKKQLCPEPDWDKLLNSDPQKLNADPQPWFFPFIRWDSLPLPLKKTILFLLYCTSSFVEWWIYLKNVSRFCYRRQSEHQLKMIREAMERRHIICKIIRPWCWNLKLAFKAALPYWIKLIRIRAQRFAKLDPDPTFMHRL